jgi:hypothetical protein
MAMYAGGNDANMQPGVPCENCHVLLGAATGHTFDVSGTVYPTAHEPDDCNGTNVTGATVVITDKNGTDYPLAVTPWATSTTTTRWASWPSPGR